MSILYLALAFLMLDLAVSDNKKRLVLHSDLDIDKALHDLKLEINATKKENLALKTQTAQEIQALKAQMEQQIQTVQIQMTHENQALKAEIAHLRNGQGSTYVRWGRTVCEGNGTQKVYSGYAGGSYYNVEGGASNTLCLPEVPSWATYKDGIQSLGGYVYGTEYEIHEATFNPFGKHMEDDDAPCVLCHSTRSVTTMIPGSTMCYPGWTKEYQGYLMTNHQTYKGGTEYACVDKYPEAVLHGEDDKNGHLFYFTEVQCGSLPCQEYPQGRELACVVCSK